MEQLTTKREPYIRLLGEVVRMAIKDVTDAEIKHKRTRSSNIDYATALSYLNSDRSTEHLRLMGIDMTGKEILERIRDGRIKPIFDDEE